MGLYLNPTLEPANGISSKYEWIQDKAKPCYALPKALAEFPSGKTLIIYIALDFEPLWVIDTQRELDRMWTAFKSDFVLERNTNWWWLDSDLIKPNL